MTPYYVPNILYMFSLTLPEMLVDGRNYFPFARHTVQDQRFQHKLVHNSTASERSNWTLANGIDHRAELALQTIPPATGIG